MTQAYGCSDVGCARISNEDCFLADQDHALFVVADGMGGERGGELASRLAVETIADFVRASRTDHQITWPYGLDRALSFEANQLRNAVHLANDRVLAEGRRRPELRGMGSTVVVALVRNGRVVHTGVGDSRLYRWSTDRRLTQLSTDHSWASSMVQAGVDPASIRNHPMRHMLTSALGAADRLDVDVSDAALADGDLLLLCTDGLHSCVTEHEMTRALEDDAESLDGRAARLLRLAIDAGGPDNVTVVLVRYESDAGRGPSRLRA